MVGGNAAVGARRGRGRRLILTLTAAALAMLLLVSVAGAKTARASSFPPPGPPDISTQNCTNCVPPLVYGGGPVLGTAGPVTITPIFWIPPGYNMPSPTYQSLIDQFLSDVSAASTANTNVFSATTEYSQTLNGQPTTIGGQINYNGDQTDTDPYPAGGCPTTTGFTICLTDAQMKTELMSYLAANNLPEDMSHIYALMFPAQVENAFSSTDSYPANYCAYHNYIQNGTNTILWMNEPAPILGGCSGGQSPNNDPVADAEISILSHEIIESMTDPLVNAWLDSKGNEIGDECAWTFGPPLGSTDTNNPNTTQYNQVINGDDYYIQTMFSNADFAAGPGFGCVTGEAQVALDTAPAPAGQFAQARRVAKRPHNEVIVSAGEPAVSMHQSTPITVHVINATGRPVANDHITMDLTADEHATSVCGKLSSLTGNTDAAGNFKLTYTAAMESVECSLIAIEAATGQHGMTTLYLGKIKHFCPKIAFTASSLLVKGRATRFSAAIHNPGPDIDNAILRVSITGSGSSGITANQVRLGYRQGRRGRWRTAVLVGSTKNAGAIAGNLGSVTSTFRRKALKHFQFRLVVNGHVISGKSLRFTLAVNQMNLASGSPDGMYGKSVVFKLKH
jgi:hypothetical protein